MTLLVHSEQLFQFLSTLSRFLFTALLTYDSKAMTLPILPSPLTSLLKS